MPVTRLKNYLETKRVPYRVIKHETAYTSRDTAVAALEPAHEFAKTVMLMIDDLMVMVVIPSDYSVDLSHLRQLLGARNVRLAREQEFQRTFPDCEPGAMPPLGELYGIDVFIDDSFGRQEMIAFNAGTHQEVIKMRYEDFRRITNAKPLRFLLVFAQE